MASGKKQKLNTAFLVSECVPFCKTGGLADVAGSLPQALGKLNCNIKIFLPLYRQINVSEFDLVLQKDLTGLSVFIDGIPVSFHVWYSKLSRSKVEVYFIENEHYFGRPALYTDDADEDERFILLQRAAFSVMQQLRWSPHILHCNDWQTALAPVMLKEEFARNELFAGTASVLSLHNIGYQGVFKKESIIKAGLPKHYDFPTGPFEFYGKFNFLKAGIVFADALNTVSPTYAREIQQKEFGFGLNGVLTERSDSLWGILNGIDDDEWNPKKDPHIVMNYDSDSISKKLQNKKDLLERLGMPFDEKVPVIGLITRLVSQKGVELLQAALGEIMRLPLQIVALGSGDPKLEKFFKRASKAWPDKFYSHIGYNNKLAHRITAGADMFLMPSRYEPCGLNQMYSLKYGTVPIVRKTGGLADTVKDVHEYYGSGTGFSFNDFDSVALYVTIRRALDVFKHKKEWRSIIKRAMQQDFSWRYAARQYRQLYELAIKRKQNN